MNNQRVIKIIVVPLIENILTPTRENRWSEGRENWNICKPPTHSNQ